MGAMGGGTHRALAFAAAAFCAAAWAQAPQELRSLIDQGKPEAAYQLARRTPERLGEPEFDLLFGIAAVHSGHAAEGVLALERFILVQPRHEAARLELARGYFLLGDDARARGVRAGGREPAVACDRTSDRRTPRRDSPA